MVAQRPPWLGDPEIEQDPGIQKGDNQFAMKLAQARAQSQKARVKAQAALQQAQIDAKLAQDNEQQIAKGGFSDRLLSRRDEYKSRLEQLAKAQSQGQEQPTPPSSNIPEISIDTQRPRPQDGLMSSVTEGLMAQTQQNQPQPASTTTPVPSTSPAPGPQDMGNGITLGGGPTGPGIVNQTTTSRPDQPLGGWERLVYGLGALARKDPELARAAIRGNIPGETVTYTQNPTQNQIMEEAGQMRLAKNEGLLSDEQWNAYLERLQTEYGGEAASRVAMMSRGAAALETKKLQDARKILAYNAGSDLVSSGYPQQVAGPIVDALGRGDYDAANQLRSQAGMDPLHRTALEGAQLDNQYRRLQLDIGRAQWEMLKPETAGGLVDNSGDFFGLTHPGQDNPYANKGAMGGWARSVGVARGLGMGSSSGRGSKTDPDYTTREEAVKMLGEFVVAKKGRLGGNVWQRDPGNLPQYQEGSRALLYAHNTLSYIDEDQQIRTAPVWELVPAALAISGVYDAETRAQMTLPDGTLDPKMVAAADAEATQRLGQFGIKVVDRTPAGSTLRRRQLVQADPNDLANSVVGDFINDTSNMIIHGLPKMGGGFQQLDAALQRMPQAASGAMDWRAAGRNLPSNLGRAALGAAEAGRETLGALSAVPEAIGQVGAGLIEGHSAVVPGLGQNPEAARARGAAARESIQQTRRTRKLDIAKVREQMTPPVLRQTDPKVWEAIRERRAKFTKGAGRKYEGIRAKEDSDKDVPKETWSDWVRAHTMDVPPSLRPRAYQPGAPNTYSPIRGETAVPEAYPQQNPRALFRNRVP